MVAMAALQWLGMRVLVGVCALGFVLALAQLTVYLLIAAFANLTPYAGP